MVESGCGAVAVGSAYLLPPLSSGGASLAEPITPFPHPAHRTGRALLTHRAQGRYGEAEPLHQRSLAIWERALGPEHPDVALSLENYALLLRHTARADEAARLEARAKAIRANSQ